MFYDMTNNKEITLAKIRKENTEISVPSKADTLEIGGTTYKKIVESERPTADEWEIVITNPVEVVNGIPTRTYSVVAVPLGLAKDKKLEQIKEAYVVDSTAPVADGNGVTWHGGDESARKINEKATMLEYAGQATGQIFDFNDNYHTLTIAEMRAVAFAIAQAYEAKLYQYKQLVAQVDSVTTTAEVEAIEYGS